MLPLLTLILRRSGTIRSWLALLSLSVMILTDSVTCQRRNSKFARHWETLDRLKPKINIKRHIVEQTR